MNISLFAIAIDVCSIQDFFSCTKVNNGSNDAIFICISNGNICRMWHKQHKRNTLRMANINKKSWQNLLTFFKNEKKRESKSICNASHSSSNSTNSRTDTKRLARIKLVLRTVFFFNSLFFFKSVPVAVCSSDCCRRLLSMNPIWFSTTIVYFVWLHSIGHHPRF